MRKIFIVLLFMAITVLNANASDFLTPKLEKAKKEKKFVMLELGSKGCIPCEKMRPVMDRLTKEYGRRLEVIFVDVRENPDIAKQWGVYVIPVQAFLNKDGVEVHRHIGYYPFEDIVKVLKKLGI